MITQFAQLFVANSCYGCESPLTIQEKCICLSCLSQIQETQTHLKISDNELYYRLAGRIPLDGAMSLFYFAKSGRLQKILQHLKYKSAPRLGVFLGQYYGHILRGGDWLGQVNAVVPVPLHASRLIQRGYNQSEQIARGLSIALDIPLETQLLKRSRKTLTQTRKAGGNRWENVSGAFELKKNPPAGLLLVDDVITTGATLEACIRTLSEAKVPPEKIYIASIGMAKKD
ncbi:MAG: ComF family protein [Bacteroidia bacterium]|nr:ComF family protein [Bacteroidia bacterium]